MNSAEPRSEERRKSSTRKAERPLNYAQLKTEFLVALRGARSQSELSKELGYSFNQLHKWEAHKKILRWVDVVRICKISKVPLGRALSEVLCFAPDDPLDSAGLISHIVNNLRSEPVKQVAKKLNCHVSVLKRWMNGSVDPDFESVLAILDSIPNTLITFLTYLVPISKMPSLATRYAKEELLKSVMVECPFSMSIANCFYLAAYRALPKHDDNFVAQKTHLKVEDVKSTIQLLLLAGAIEKIGRHYRACFQTINLDGILKSTASMGRYWTEQSLTRFNTPNGLPKKNPNSSLFAYRVLPASKKTAKKANELLIRCFSEIIALAEADNDPAEELRVLVVHHFSPEELPSEN